MQSLDFQHKMERECATNKRKSSPDAGKTNVYRIENTIYFSDNINYNTAHELIQTLRNFELDVLEDVKNAESEARKAKAKYATVVAEPMPIVLHLTTHGGLVHAAFAIVDCIKSLRVPVHTVVSGYVASAGTLISLAGAKRYMTPNSFMMIHEVRSGFWGRYSDMRVEHENITKLMEHISAYYVANTKITKEKLTEMLRTDTDLSATEARELGLVDEIK